MKRKPNYAREQNALFRKMQNESLNVMFGVNAVKPSLAVLKGRYRAAVKLYYLARSLESSLYNQIAAKRSVK